MWQLTLKLSPEIDENAFLKVLKNLTGVKNIHITKAENNKPNEEKVEKILKSMKDIRNCIDKSLIDYNDEKTKYILSK